MRLSDGLASVGFDSVQLDGDQRRILGKTRAEAQAFFDRPDIEKQRYAWPATARGYRAMGLEYSVDPASPDRNESYSYWADTGALMDAVGGATSLRKSFAAAFVLLEGIAREFIDRLSLEMTGREETIPFRDASYLQINHTPADPTGGRIQDRHEDGHLVTFHQADGSGLVVHGPDGDVRLPPDPARLLIMPGSTLTLMSGGLVAPLEHSVEAGPTSRSRLATMYFVNLDPRFPIEPFVLNETNRGIDVADHINRAPERFGLPPLVGDP